MIREFSLKAGNGRFTPNDLIELPRPDAGKANVAGDLVLVSVSKYSFAEKINHKSIFIASLESAVEPVEIPLAHGGETFWLDDRTIGHVVTDDESKTAGIYTISILVTNDPCLNVTSNPPVLLGKFPTASPSNFRYVAKAGVLVFSDNVYEDGDLNKVPENDDKWQDRGNTALVYDNTYERHWDTWTGPKRPSLFTVKLFKDVGKHWRFGDEFYNVLHGTGHVSRDWCFPFLAVDARSVHTR